MKKTVKVISTLLMVSIVLLSIGSNVQAVNTIIDNMQPNYNNTGEIGNIGGKLTSIISTVGIVIAVIVLLILGIKYMIGSASEKAEYKKTMIPYLVGAILVFGASAIAKVVINMASTITQ